MASRRSRVRTALGERRGRGAAKAAADAAAAAERMVVGGGAGGMSWSEVE